MIANLETDALPALKETDICIVGAGAAGQTLASRLARANVSCLMVEAGGRDFRADVQNLMKGESVGEPYYALDHSRLRMFGGTAAIWGGRCAELDAVDFEKRDYLPHSGWPISKADLDTYYEDVFKNLGLKRPVPGKLWSEISRSAPAFDPEKLTTDLWVFDEDFQRFTTMKSVPEKDCTLLLNANVTQINVNDAGAVSDIRVNSLNGRMMDVKAKIFVLAAGAMENIRLLSGAVPQRPQGLGNDKDLLGRFFMEHPHARGGEIVPTDVAHSLTILPRSIRKSGRRYAAYMRPADSFQKSKGILNTSLSIGPRRFEGEKLELFRQATNRLKHDLPSKAIWRKLYTTGKGLATRGLEATDPWSSIMNMKLSRQKMGIFAIIRAEQAPNPDSRVFLSSSKDALGLRQLKLDWRLSEIDRRSVAVLMETLGQEYERLGWGHVKPAEWLSDETVTWKTDPLISAHPIGGYHHMGGTRMSEDATTGIVNADCRLHDSPNLYIASSSVFPTGGWANPTVTIMALALRLGDHLTMKLKSSQAHI